MSKKRSETKEAAQGRVLKDASGDRKEDGVEAPMSGRHLAWFASGKEESTSVQGVAGKWLARTL